MKAGNSPGSKEIVDLLAKLKTLTPEYPADRLVARRAAFLKQIAALNSQVQGRSGTRGAQEAASE